MRTACLIEKNMALIKWCAYKNCGGIDPEEAFSEALLAAAQGVAGFRGDRGCQLSTFLCTCIENRLNKSRRHQRAAKRGWGVFIDSLNAPLGETDVEFADTIPDPRNDTFKRVVNREKLRRLRTALTHLSEREKTAVEAHTNPEEAGKTLKQLAAEWCVTEKSLLEFVEIGLRRLRVLLEKERLQAFDPCRAEKRGEMLFSRLTRFDPRSFANAFQAVPLIPWYLDKDSGGPNPIIRKEGIQYAA